MGTNITNSLEYKGTPKKSLVFKTDRDQITTIKNTLSRLKRATMSAKNVDYPNRQELLSIYNDIKDDAHLSALLQHRKSRITGLQWSVTKIGGKVDDIATGVFSGTWFNLFLDYCLGAIFEGNSLIEILPDNGKLIINLIPRENVIPEFKQIKTNAFNSFGDIDYSAPIYSKQLIDVNNNYSSRDLGELLAVTKLVLFKNEVMLNWSQYVELFGQPMRVATSDSQDPVELANIESFLKELGRSGYVVKDSNTQLDFTEASGSGKSELYNDFIKTTNAEMSKKILGGTMLTDDGSSKSQGEVHERGSLLFTKSDILFIENVINNDLIPMLQRMGYLKTKSLVFNFDEPEIMTIEEKLKTDEFLVANFNIKDIEYFSKRYGVELEFKNKEVINGKEDTNKGIEENPE